MEDKEDLFTSIKNALSGNFELMRPTPCKGPPNDETYILQQTEDQLDTSILSTDTEGFNTAYSDCIGDSDSDLDEFIIAEKLINSLPDDVELPANTCDELIFCNSQGKIQKVKSALKWIRKIAGSNQLDCAAQISTQEISDKTTVPITPKKSATATTAADLSTGCELDCIADNATGECGVSQQNTSSNVPRLSKSHSNCFVLDSVSNLVQRIDGIAQDRKSHDSHSKLSSDTEPTMITTEQSHSALTRPLADLPIGQRTEIHALLKETTEALDVSSIAVDESRSSIQLLRSIIIEAGRRFGLDEGTWARQIHDVVALAHKDRKAESTTKVAKESDQSTNKVISKEGGPRVIRASSTKCPCSGNQASRRQHPAGDSRCSPNTSIQLLPSNHASDNFKTPLNVDSEDQFFTCQPPRQEARGVRASLRSLNKRQKCICKAMMRREAPIRRLPKVEEFKISTKSGAHSLYQVLKTTLTLPSNQNQSKVVEPTVPVLLQSEAMWKNGQLCIRITDVDKDKGYLPKNHVESFNRLPHSIKIDFIREYKRDKTSQHSPLLLRRNTTHRTCSPGRQMLDHHFETSPRPFNTKVDYIFKKDPLILGTLDKDRVMSRKIAQKKRLKTGIPTYCVV